MRATREPAATAPSPPTSPNEAAPNILDHRLWGYTFAYCLLPIAYCLLPIAYCLLPIAYCLKKCIFAPDFNDKVKY